jgi:hypothetical protein
VKNPNNRLSLLLKSLISVITLSVIFVFSTCSSKKNLPVPGPSHEEVSVFIPDAPLIIYKTKADYSANVPVIMDENRTRIIAYPAPSDLLVAGKLTLPVFLNQGFMLDNRGIGLNVVFLKYTYKEYSQLEATPTMAMLMNNILETYPLTAMYRCGLRNEYRNMIVEINVLIDRGLTNCEKLYEAPVLQTTLK